ncbi:hypothetical protein FKM82_013661 [Ascaphus truei]|uniref:transcription factor HES-5-like n=1 Tax=Ascaphus truei TaxID=8439 RepID=UPI003F5AB0EA
MAPNTFLDHNKLTPKEKNKLRKPAVEKMRRDRINSSIEHLKLLLETEFHKQQPNVKLEKADILEMTVTYLRQQRLSQTKNTVPHNKDVKVDFKDGYSRCYEEVLDFLTLHQKQQETQEKLMNHFHARGATTISALSPVRHCHSKQADTHNSSTLWRPW